MADNIPTSKKKTKKRKKTIETVRTIETIEMDDDSEENKEDEKSPLDGSSTEINDPKSVFGDVSFIILICCLFDKKRLL